MEVKVTNANFEDEVLKSDKTVLVDFWAEWCGPCRMLGPVLKEIADENEETLKVCKVNVDEEPELAKQFGIMSIPFVASFKNGEIYKTSVGAQPKDQILELLA